ncbi:MAG: SIS domain-containing protein [Bryobacteraceae bacterium]
MSFPRRYQAELMNALQSIDFEKVDRAIAILAEARDQGRRIFVCGNGGSAAMSSHFATDLVKGASFGRQARFRILSLVDSIPTLTAYSNDVSYECVFVEQLKNFAEAGDVVLVVSSSGNSLNVVRAIEYGNSIGCQTIALTGRDGGKLGPVAQLNIQVPHAHTGRIEDAHGVILHMIGYSFMEERREAQEHE